jgi:hypothetical protein
MRGAVSLFFWRRQSWLDLLKVELQLEHYWLRATDLEEMT